MIMSAFTQIEMSFLKNGKVPFLKSKGGYIARKGHYHNECRGVKEVEHNSQASREKDKPAKSF